ncbi:MAG: hypothetical protein ACREOL_09950 [Candidatus Dormibacteria bacterium]
MTTAIHHRRASDRLPEIQLEDDELQVAPGTFAVSYSSSGHEHTPDERGIVKCGVCADAQRLARSKGETATRVDVNFEVGAEDGLALRQLASGAGLSLSNYLRQLALAALAQHRKATKAKR